MASLQAGSLTNQALDKCIVIHVIAIEPDKSLGPQVPMHLFQSSNDFRLRTCLISQDHLHPRLLYMTKQICKI